MKKLKTTTIAKTLVIITFIAMVIVNALANIIPLNGINTGQVSDSYPNLFAPAALTFAIWGLIYLLLAVFSVYQLGFSEKNTTKIKSASLDKIRILFSISSVANLLWIFSWHYLIIPLSMILMLVILICLIFIMESITKEQLSLKEKIFIKLPFSIYFGWITVATIANATVLLVSLNWNGFEIRESLWTIFVIIIGTIIGIATTLKNKDVAYALVIIWAYFGILIKHFSPSGFAGQYPGVIVSAILCIVLLFVSLVCVLISNSNIKKIK